MKRGLFFVVVFQLFLTEMVLAQKDLVISGGNSVSSFVCANRRVYVWGNNLVDGNRGALGTGNTTDDFLNTPTAVTIPGNLDIKQVNSGSGSHFVALDCNGGVWSWGNNSFGQVGNGAVGGCDVFVAAPTKVLAGVLAGTAYDDGTGHLANADVVYAGNNNSFAILGPGVFEGRLVSWGGNSNGCSPP